MVPDGEASLASGGAGQSVGEPGTAAGEETADQAAGQPGGAEADGAQAEAGGADAEAGREEAAGEEAGGEEPGAEEPGGEEEADPVAAFMTELRSLPGDWYVVHSYAGYENRVKGNLESRTQSLNMEDYIYQVEVPVHEVTEVKGGKRQQVSEKV
ncbi:MAG: transcription termination/antitermination protein NusG, partial [Actinobacteria bacterium]|nr:transcription termination/antitermination protein NusG [Actinomycetota bacterium]